MDIIELADKYAEGKANQAITQAIADAYVEGYKAGYKDRENEISMEFRDCKTNYVDLGLPSGTLWSTDYEKQDGKYLYLPYMKARQMNLPTKEQWEELLELCRWDLILEKRHGSYWVNCVGPNGQVLTFYAHGMQTTSYINYYKYKEIFFWIRDNCNNEEKQTVHICEEKVTEYEANMKKELIGVFSGFHLPVRLVR